MLYNQAVDGYYRHYYRQALTRFGRVQQLAPDYPGLAAYITGAQQAVAAGEDRTPPSSPGPPWLVVIPAVAGVGLLGTLTVCAVLRRRGRCGAAP